MSAASRANTSTGTSADPSIDPRARDRRVPVSRRLAVLWALAAGAAILGAGAQTWVRASGIAGLGGTEVTVSGNEAAAVVPAMALVAMAGGLALTIARTVGRVLIAVLLILAGVVASATALDAVQDPIGAASSLVSQASGTTDPAGEYTVTIAPWLTLVAAVLLVLCGIAVLVFGRRWPTTSRRYEAPAAREAAAEAAGDRTARAAGSSTGASTAAGAASADAASIPPDATGPTGRSPAEPGTSARHAAGTSADTAAGTEEVDEIDAWDALSRGNDPT